MPILHTINEQLGIVLSSWVGQISDSELLPSYQQLYENELWKPGFHEIVDLRDADMSSVSSEGLDRLASMVKRYTIGKCDEFKTAVVAPDDLHFGIARIYEVHSSESPEIVMVFRDLNRAFEWLGIENTLLE